MRKLKLQVQITADGFVAGPNGELDWMTWKWDDPLTKFVNQLTDTSDTILLGRKMTDGFIGHWEKVKPESPEYAFAKKMVDTQKIVFSKTVKTVNGNNVRVENGDLVAAIDKLKAGAGKDIIVYGGAGFVTSMINHDLIDELNLFINPATIGSGLRIFSGRKNLKLLCSATYGCGIVVNTYGIGE